MRRTVLTMTLSLSALALVAARCDGDDVVTTTDAADPAVAPESGGDADATSTEAEGAPTAAVTDPPAASVDEAVQAPEEGSKAPGSEGDIFTDPLEQDSQKSGGPIDELGDTPPIDDTFLDDPSFEPEAPPGDPEP